ncbi:uncharacterized protein LOC107800903 isoform X2 [Nicotiana tabacum]|uniref:Uncharacterized protein LOC107800903 isoform X2 n=1 Tax=Nicotiana tabacum TaxID=4097 RepID=A0A1S4AT20_TOBAC|nr:PREDICTED: uncharacterized protein LOC107800903 isoform X2 [Nicotiana tabacum]
MPGTIQVSVLDFKNISSPAPPSSICLWVSMGKRAYQTWDKGDFSFPLTTFRENLVVRLQDAEGNEISRTEVQTLSIVEKGYWDDFFQLEGGDYVHMKLQFILSEDDRNRIRNVRESALKKKQYIVPATNVEYKGTTIPVGDTFASSLPIRRKLSDRSEATSSSPVKEGVQIQYSEPDRPSVKKVQTPLIRDYISVKPVNEQDAQSMFKMDVAAKKEYVSQKTIADPYNKPEDQSAKSMLKMVVAVKEETVSQMKIIDPSNKSQDQSGQSMLKMDVAAKKESVPQKKIVDPSSKPEDQGAQSMLRMDVPAKEESMPQNKIGDPSNKPENQSGRSMFKMDVAAKKESVSNKKIVDPSSKPEDQGAQYVLRVNVAAKKESVSETKIVDPPNKPEDQRVLEKTPSSVRNMISAFETGLAQKGRRSLTRNRASKSQPNLVGIGGSLKDLDPEDTAMPNKMSALRVERPLNNANLPEPQRNIDKRGESSPPEHKIDGPGQPVFYEKLKQSSVHIVPFNEAGSSQRETLTSAKESNSEATSPVDLVRRESSSREQDIVGTGQPVFHEQLKQSSVHIVPFNEAGSGQQDTLRSTKKESNTVATSPVDLMRLSNLETATSSQRINVAHSDMLNANNLAADQDRSSDPSVAEQRNREIRSEALLEVHIERVPNEKPKLIAYCENEHYDSENSGVWIFPDNKNRVCITTAGESTMHLLEDYHAEVDDHQRNKKPPKQEITGKRGFFHKSDSTIKKGGEKPQKPRKSQTESSGQNGPSGPVRQVIKIAVIVGFGILVLLTRQKETRRNDRKSKEFYFASPDFMDQLASSEEKWSLLSAEGI